MSWETKTCADCPFYLWEEWFKRDHAWLNRDLRQHYCAHPAFLESYGVEQAMGTSSIGEARTWTQPHECLIAREDGWTPERVWQEIVGNCSFYEHLTLHGPAISSVSKLHRKS